MVVCAALILIVVPGTNARADRRADANNAATRALATIDSLLQIPAADQAILTARKTWSELQHNPVYGWQVEGRLGLALLMAGQAEAAVPHLESVVRQQPRQANHHRNLGAALLQLNRRGRALSEYAVAVELDPGDADLRREYGQMLLAFRDTEGAARELHLARDLCGQCPEMDQPLASLYLMQKNYALAIPCLHRLYEKDSLPETRRTLVATMLHAGRDSALINFITGLAEPQRSGEEWRLLIEAEGRQGQSAHSLLMVRRLQTNTADSLPAALVADDQFWGQVALNLLSAEMFAAGLEAVEQAISLDSQNVVYLNNKVVLLTKLGRDAEARAAWEKVIILDPSLASQSN